MHKGKDCSMYKGKDYSAICSIHFKWKERSYVRLSMLQPTSGKLGI